MTIVIVCSAIYAIATLVVCVKLAQQKNKNTILAGFCGFLFGILAVLYYGFVAKQENNGDSDTAFENGKLRSSLTNMLVVLTVITIIAAGVLAAVNAVTAPQIEKINADNLAAGIKAVMCSEDIQVSEPWESAPFTIYDISDNSGNKLGKAVVTTENGFGGPLKVLVGFNPEGDILGYTLLEHAETPGLGAKADVWFQDKIVGVNPGKSNFTVSKDGGDIDAITASTITSRAFLLAIQKAYDKAINGSDATTGATQQAHGEKGGKCGKKGECAKACQSGCTASEIGTPDVIE